MLNKVWLTRTGIASAVAAVLVVGAVGISNAQAPVEDFQRPVVERPARGENAERPGPRLSVELAEELGMTVEELRTALDDGQTIEQLAANAGVDLEALRAEHQAERQAEAIAHVQEELAQGDITQQEADERIERIENGERGSDPAVVAAMVNDPVAHAPLKASRAQRARPPSAEAGANWQRRSACDTKTTVGFDQPSSLSPRIQGGRRRKAKFGAAMHRSDEGRMAAWAGCPEDRLFI
ncbi:MAG: hypothetical protein HC802_01220 [Caldilineaceae bacterium]|nr:hypothetical protein [Caldilineaceae bacterium]